MTIMVPTVRGGGPTLAAVLPSCLSSLSAATAAPGANLLSLPEADRIVIVLVDGLGTANLRARSGHARSLIGALHRDAVEPTSIASGWPTTTAAALASFSTGSSPGQHGLVGYSVLDPEADAIVNQLSGWGGPGSTMDPSTWQRLPTVFERASERGIPSFAVGHPKYQQSGFTQAVLRGSTYVPASTIAARFAAAESLFAAHPRCLIYLYIPELDMAAHARGWQSDRWTNELEEVDRAVAALAAGLGDRDGMLLTADHGMIDVPSSRHVLFDSDHRLVQGVRHVGGDPRCVHLYLEPGLPASDAARLLDDWRSAEGDRAWVLPRSEAIASGWFGAVAAEVAGRIGDILVAAKDDFVYYDSRSASPGSQAMIGQHGSWSDAELMVPLLRFGAFAQTR